MIVKTSQQWFKINGNNAFGCPLRMGLYLKVECMNLSKPTLAEPQSPRGYGKVPFAMSGPPNLTNTGDSHKNNYKNTILEINE